MEQLRNPLEKVDFGETISDDVIRKCKIEVTGHGSIFTQGLITLEDYYIIKQYQEANELSEIEAWEKAIDGEIDGFESEKYFTDNLRAFFQGIHLASDPVIRVRIDGGLKAVASFENLNKAGVCIEEINVSKDGNKVCTTEDVGKVSATNIEYKDNLIMSKEFDIKGKFDVEKLWLITGYADEVVVGNRIQDFLLGFKYGDDICDPYLSNNPYGKYETSDNEIIYSLIYDNEINGV